MAAVTPLLEPGRVYRTRELSAWTTNAPRLARRLVEEGTLVPLAHGLFAHPKPSRFGPVPPRDEEIVRAFLDGGPFIFTGPERWNALGLGTTAVFVVPLVYNTKRSGIFTFGSRRMVFRRVAFPENPPVEWFVIDLFEHADQAAASPVQLAEALGRALAHGRFDRDRLMDLARRYGSRATQVLVAGAA
ncbi:MAG: hypothetical protein VKP72_09515 [bacterium]|nr:hypothetical protein [bacterium]